VTAASLSPNAVPPHGALILSPMQMLALVVVACMGFSSQMLMPIWVGQIVDGYGIPAATAGKIASFEMFLVAATSALVSFLIGRVPRVGLTVAGMTLLVVGNSLCVAFHDVVGLTLCRAATGIGKGLMVAALFSLAGQTANPTRSFAIINAGYAAFSAIAFLSSPYFVHSLGPEGVFFLTTALSLIGVAFTPWLPRVGRDAAPARLAPPSLSRIAQSLRGHIAGVIILATFFVYSTAHDCLWVFVERLGAQLNIGLPAIGTVLSISALVAVAGPWIANIAESRFGVTRPLVGGVIAVAASGVAMAATGNVTVFEIMVPLFAALSMFTIPYFQGMLGLADSSGGLAAMSLAVSTGGAAFGALVGAWTIAGGGYPALAPVSLVLFVMVLAALALMASSRSVALPER
jgi:predicted MFS family arabinose efflux permease